MIVVSIEDCRVELRVNVFGTMKLLFDGKTVSRGSHWVRSEHRPVVTGTLESGTLIDGYARESLVGYLGRRYVLTANGKTVASVLT